MNRLLTKLTLLLLVASTSVTSRAAVWTAIGPHPPAVEAPIAVDAKSETIYIASYGGGVLKSTDGGETYAWVNQGLDDLAISSMAMHPADNRVVVVGTLGHGLYRTEDGGAHWSVTSDATGVITFVAVDPRDPLVWYAGYMSAAVLRKSIDGGKTWANANTGLPVTSVWSIVADSEVVYIATAGGGAFKSTNAGASWTAMPVRPVVWSLALDPQDSRVIYAGVNGEGIFRSIDGGATFDQVGSPSVGVVLSIAVDPTDSDVMYAATSSGGVERSDNGGRTWKKTSIRKGIAITVRVTSAGDVYVGTAFEGAFRSKRIPAAEPAAAVGPSSAESWSQAVSERPSRHSAVLFTEIVADELRSVNAQNIVNIKIDPSDSNHVLLGTNDGGLLGTIDGGARWLDVGGGFTSRASRRAAFDPVNAGRVYAGSFSGGGLFRSDDNGFTWKSRAVGSPVSYVWATAVDPFNGDVYAGTQNGEGLWRSTNGGDTFVRIDGSAIPNMRDIVFDATTRGKMFVAGTGGLFRSLDGGVTFTKVASGAMNTVSIDPTNASVVYAGTQTAGVLKSADGGATFTPINTGLVTTFSTSRGNGVAIDPTDPSTLYVGTEGAGVFKSINGGASWFAINDGLTNLRVFAIELDRKQPNVLYVGGGYGVFKTTTGGQ